MMVTMTSPAAAVAQALRNMLAAAPPTTARDRRLAARLQGAIIGLEAPDQVRQAAGQRMRDALKAARSGD